MNRIVTGILAAAALAAPSAQAQAQDAGGGLTAEQAREFVSALGEQAREAVEADEWEGVSGWIADHVEDEARIHVEGAYQMSSGPAGSYEMTLSGAHLKRFARMALLGPQGEAMTEALSDYRLEVEVDSAWQIPGDKVSIAVNFYETGRLDFSAMMSEGAGQAGGGGQDAAEPEIGGVFSAATTCAMRLGGSGEDIVIEMAFCEVMAQL